MRIAWILAGALAAAGLASAQDIQAVGRGHALYLVNCMSCHGADARGVGGAAAPAGVAIPDLTRIAERDGAFRPTHVMLHVGGERSSAAERRMVRFHQGFSNRDTEAAAVINVYCLTRYLETIQGGVPQARQLPEQQ
jgi:cytochrome c553